VRTQRDVVESDIVLARAGSVVFACAVGAKACKRPKIHVKRRVAPHVQPREHLSDLHKSECRRTQRDVVESESVLERAGSVVFACAVGAESWKRPKIHVKRRVKPHVQPREH
jgi:hypothetical protein